MRVDGTKRGLRVVNREPERRAVTPRVCSSAVGARGAFNPSLTPQDIVNQIDEDPGTMALADVLPVASATTSRNCRTRCFGSPRGRLDYRPYPSPREPRLRLGDLDRDDVAGNRTANKDNASVIEPCDSIAAHRHAVNRDRIMFHHTRG